MADKRVRRLDQRAYRLWRLAQRLRDRSDGPVEVLPEDDWFDTVTFERLTVTCRPTVPLDPDEPWLFTVHHGEPPARSKNDHRGAGIEIDADTLTTAGGVQVRGGNVDVAAQQIIGIAAASDHAPGTSVAVPAHGRTLAAASTRATTHSAAAHAATRSSVARGATALAAATGAATTRAE